MQFNLITPTRERGDFRDAVRLVALGGKTDLELIETVSEFLNQVSRLPLGTAAGAETITLPDGTTSYIVANCQGVGDLPGDWVADIGWLVDEYPELLSTLGIRIDTSTGVFGAGQESYV
jgi:hypothetical protein